MKLRSPRLNPKTLNPRIHGLEIYNSIDRIVKNQ